MLNSSPRHASALSERLYRFLLLAYPRAFREDYAAEMFLVFRDAYRETSRQQGSLGVLRLWSVIAGDLVKTVGTQWVRDRMCRSERKVALAGKEQVAMALQFTLDVAQRTDIGRARANNEDNLIAVVPEDHELLRAKGALFVVSDGMGGHDHGEVASELTVQTVKDSYYHDPRNDIPTALRKAIEQANASVCQANTAARARGASGFGMGATCVAAVLHEQTLYAANVGDSRVYVLHDGQLRQITRDHSLVAQLVEQGKLTPEEARAHEQRNIIYRSLGCADVEVDIFTETVQEGDTLILCTDGLCAVVEDDDLRAIVEQYGPEESVRQLIARANDAGGPDNVTAIVVRVAVA